MPTDVINNFAEFLEAIEKINNSKSEGLSFFYRGNNVSGYSLLKPSIFRDDKNEDVYKEPELIRDVLAYSPEEFKEEKTTFEILAKMQHFGMPTRLLDITSNPLVALYFACEKEEGKDGEVFVLSVRSSGIFAYYDAIVSLFSNIAMLPRQEKAELDIISLLSNPPFNRDKKDESSTKETQGFGESAIAKELLFLVNREHPGFSGFYDADNLGKEVHNAIFVRPKMNNKRIIAQAGAFLLYGSRSITVKSKNSEQNPLWSADYIIKKEAKPAILETLKHLGIDRISLFPDIQTVISEVKKHNNLQTDALMEKE